MNASVIEARGLRRHFGAVRAVDGVDLTVEPGELFGLIGHNGAGKTTLFRMMLGLIAPSGGSLRVHGEPPRGEAFRQLRRRIGYVPENVVLYDNLSGIETLRFYADLKGAARADCAATLERVGLAGAATRRVREYSRGMRQRLGLAQALLGEPSLLFLDEPTSGLDPEATRAVYRLLGELRERGVTVVLTSHVLAELQDRVDRLAIMKCGRIQAVGTVRSLRESANLPLQVDVALDAQREPELRALLADLPVDGLRMNGDGRLHLSCPREAKMRLLARLASLEGRVADVNVREPSLEDIFLGNGR